MDRPDQYNYQPVIEKLRDRENKKRSPEPQNLAGPRQGQHIPSGLGYQVLILETGGRVPVGVLEKTRLAYRQAGFSMGWHLM